MTLIASPACSTLQITHFLHCTELHATTIHIRGTSNPRECTSVALGPCHKRKNECPEDFSREVLLRPRFWSKGSDSHKFDPCNKQYELTFKAAVLQFFPEVHGLVIHNRAVGKRRKELTVRQEPANMGQNGCFRGSSREAIQQPHLARLRSNLTLAPSAVCSTLQISHFLHSTELHATTIHIRSTFNPRECPSAALGPCHKRKNDCLRGFPRQVLQRPGFSSEGLDRHEFDPCNKQYELTFKAAVLQSLPEVHGLVIHIRAVGKLRKELTA